MVEIATPISNLFSNKKIAEGIINYSDCLECRDSSINSSYANQRLFHCELQPIHPLTIKDFRYLGYINKTKQDLKLITFHIASSGNKVEIRNKMFELTGKNFTGREMFKNAKYNIIRIKDIFGKDVKIGIENTNYYPTEAYKYVTDPEFICRLVYDNNINFLFDIAHAKITSYNKKISYEKYVEMLPLDRLIQVHISSFRVKKTANCVAYDLHCYPENEEFEDIKHLLDNLSAGYITIEYYKNGSNLINALKKLREII